MPTTKLQLGDNAASFYSPGTQLDLVPGWVAEVPDAFLTDHDIAKALTGGHIKKADSGAELTHKFTIEEKTGFIEVEDLRPEAKEAAKARTGSVKMEKDETKRTTEKKMLNTPPPETEEDEDDEPEMTKQELIDEISSNKKIPDDEKKGLSSLNKPDLQKIYDKYNK